MYVLVDEDEPELTHPRIRRSNSKYRTKKRTTTWSAYRVSWYTRKGGLNVVSFNICEVLPVTYYEQLKNVLFSYKELSPRDYFDHLDDHWCKMDTKTIKRMTKLFYEPWHQVEHVTKFARRLNDEMVYLNGHDGINITEANEL